MHCLAFTYRLLIPLCLFTCAASAADVVFKPAKDIAGGTVSGVSCIDAGRIDGDQLVDVVVVEGGMHAGGRKTFAWFRAPSDAQGHWSRHEINPTAPLRHFLGAAKLADMNGDGHLDLVVSSDNHSGGTKAADLYIFINPGPAAVTGTWSYHRVTPTTLALHHINDMEIADMDGDGKLDIVVRSLDPNQIHIIFQNSMTSWTRKVIDTGIAQSEGLAVGRINGDALPDITYTGYLLLAPANPRTGTYIKHPIDSGYKDVNQNTKEALGDIDGDGLLDIVIGPAEAFRNGGNHVLAWYKNPGVYGANWPRTVIRSGTNHHHTVKLADMNNNGHLDVVTGKPWSSTGIPKETLVFYNDGTGGFSTVQTVASGKGLYSGVIADIGNDGDLDIIGQDSYASTSKPWLYESQLAGAPAPDTQAPSAPGNFTANATGSTTIALAWNAATDNVGVTGYEIRRNGTTIATVSGTSYINAGLTAATSYTYAVRARDAAGNWSVWSTNASATTATVQTRNAFARIEAESFTSQSGLGIYNGGSGQKIGSIENGTWAAYTGVDFGSGAVQCQIRAASARNGGTISLRLGSTTGPLIGSCVVPGTGGWDHFIDLTCAVSGASGVQTLYLVFSGSGSLGLLDVDYFQFAASASGDTTAPSVPANLTATATGSASVALAWTAATDNVGVTGYEIRRNGTIIASMSGTSYTNTGLTAATPYSYAVRARDAAGNWSAWSANVSATTLSATPGRDAFARIEAESYNAQHGLGIYSGGTGQKIGSIHDGEWVRYDAVDFGAGASHGLLRASSNTSGGTIELRLGSVTGPLIGSRLIPGTGGWNNFQDFTCPISGASGVQTLFLVFRGGGGFLVDVDYFSFTPVMPVGNG